MIIMPKRYEIVYEYEGEKASTVETLTPGFEANFTQNVLNVIEGLVRAGAVITDLISYNN